MPTLADAHISRLGYLCYEQMTMAQKNKMATASSEEAILGTLAEILNVKPELLSNKFELQPFNEPLRRYSPQDKDNVVFMSPSVCLEDLELRDGGFKDRGAKEVLDRLTKDILESKDTDLFQVPEITFFHLGYGKCSKNKKSNMAINEVEAVAWMEVLDLASWKARLESNLVAVDNDESTNMREEETPMEMEFTFPTTEDTQVFEQGDSDTEDDDIDPDIDPAVSGLKVHVKPRYLLFFSILLIFYKKKLKTPSSKEDNIGSNKISDFLLFWILPYLLNYTQQQVNIVNEHHAAESKREGTAKFSVPVVARSFMDIVVEAFESCKVPGRLQKKLLQKLRKYYGTERLEHKYDLPAVVPVTRSEEEEAEPVILVPLRYQVTNMPVEIEDIGKRWREIGKVRLIDEFFGKFIENREVQEDFLFDALRDLEIKEKFAVNFGILLPDESTFARLMHETENEKPDLFRRFKCIGKQGRDLATPRIGLLKNEEKNVSVCFSYFQGTKSHQVSALFRVIGSHRVNHVTLALLYGSCVNPYDPMCKLLSLYPVVSTIKYKFKSGKPQKEKSDEAFIKGQFCKIEFPETLRTFNDTVCNDEKIKAFKTRSGEKRDYPRFEHQYPLTVAYTSRQQSKKLRGCVLAATVAPVSPEQSEEKRIKELENYRERAASLEGCLLQLIKKSGSDTTAVVMLINDTLDPDGACLPSAAKAVMERTINFFVMAVVVAGLPKVYPPEGSDQEREIESGTDEEDGGDDDDDAMDGDSHENNEVVDSGYASAGASAVDRQSFHSTPRVKEGIPDDDVLEELSLCISDAWRPLGRRLGIENATLTSFHKQNEGLREKAYEMLIYWKEKEGSNATYQKLYAALSHEFVNKKILAEQLCCE